MFDIKRMKEGREQGVMLVPSEVDELILWAFERRHVEPNEANFHRLVKHCGLSKKQEGYVMGAYRQSFDMTPRENLPGTGPHVSVGIKLDPAYVTLDLDSGVSADVAAAGVAAMLDMTGNGDFVPATPLVAPAASAAPFDFEARKLADLLSINRVYGKSGAAPAVGQPSPSMPRKIRLNQSFGKLGAAPTEPAHIKPLSMAAYGDIHAKLSYRVGKREQLDATAKVIDMLLPVYSCGLKLDGSLIWPMPEGQYYARDDVLTLFDIAD